jgi:threonine dehydrogenase-like Zn-dependent dehydrogenase
VAQPVLVGHEMSGRVAELGLDVIGWSVGEAVTVMPLVWCGQFPAIAGAGSSTRPMN